ncbi:hypothetical protein EXW35_32030 (plasmid) [Bacillus mycoides]|uniref:Phr family secreted Rap phosphatase inhibitor n=1 Tax=Bacillus mycoides TaxID=1405 RepID=A0A1W6AJ38_BACMY|nr:MULTISPECIES: hypothetical protein [Bacillus cereus group]ARJ25751.1 hypothetical protein B7492_32440 [Bacillus mycoides]MDR5021371.1 hypothetical protein [Bacillus thuringiensis]QWG42851.1 hypothetical protein EXW35_32030 [Bacillus mycoides]
MKKIVMGFIGFAVALTIGSFTESFTSQADHGRPPAPQRPDFISVDGNTELVTLDHGRPPAPAYEYSYMNHGEQI